MHCLLLTSSQKFRQGEEFRKVVKLSTFFRLLLFYVLWRSYSAPRWFYVRDQIHYILASVELTSTIVLICLYYRLIYLIEQRLHRYISDAVLGVLQALSQGGRVARLARRQESVPQLIQIAAVTTVIFLHAFYSRVDLFFRRLAPGFFSPAPYKLLNGVLGVSLTYPLQDMA